jgi:hypothetical protein
MEKLVEILIVVLIAAFMYGLYRWGHRSWDARVRGWAHDQHMHLLSFRIGSFNEGPDRYVRTENQIAVHVRVCDRTGRQQTAWLLFGREWYEFTSDDELVDVFWDD